MKNLIVILIVAIAAFTGVAQAQTSGDEYFLGKWEVLVKETPNGNVTLPARFEKKDGKLAGYFVDGETKKEKKMDTVFMNGAQINFAFNTMGYDLTAHLSRKDDDNATGSLMDMFSMEAKRVKDAAAPAASAAAPEAYFAGNWSVLIKDTPNGDATIPMRFENKDGVWKGYFTAPGETKETEMSSAKLEGGKFEFGFTIASYDVTVILEKKDDNVATGKLMNMFDVIATRKK